MTQRTHLCSLADIPQEGARGIELQVGTRKISLIVLRVDRTLHAYLNSCPHTGIRLEWRADDFMDEDGRLLQCATHAAQFAPDSGMCVAGPCRGDSLVRAQIVCEDGEAYVLAAEMLPDSARRR